MYRQYVNILQGTQSTYDYSNGNTLPLIQMPNAMDAWSIQTRSHSGHWFFHPDDQVFEGIRLTHQPSPWMGDYGHICFYPYAIGTGIGEKTYQTQYQHTLLTLKPGYMRLPLYDGVVVELVPLYRGGWFRMRYPLDKGSFVIKGYRDYELKDSFFEYNPVTKTVTGYTRQVHPDAHDHFKKYVYMNIQTEADISCVMLKDGIELTFNFTLTRIVEIQVGTSYISIEQAKLNLNQEIKEVQFDCQRSKQASIWEEALSCIEVETDDVDDLMTFYSCLYRTMLFPNMTHEINKDGQLVHYNFDTGQVHSGRFYTNVGFWDTFRTLFPLLALINPDIYSHMLEGFINQYKEVGWLPKWLAPCERGAMPGTLIDGVFADAFAKGIDFDVETAIEGMIKHANESSNERRFGRSGIGAYLKYGYVTSDINESVNQTLDYAYGDFALWKMLDGLLRTNEAQVYLKRIEAYQFLFDKETGLMRGKDSSGNFREPFDPISWGGDYCEGGAYQNSFFIAHDFDNYIKGFSSVHQFKRLLDQIFSMKPTYHVGTYGREIHEMREMADASFGQCAISNQPSFHLPYLYCLIDEEETSRYWIKKILDEGFSWKSDGFLGDEDNGSMSAWYILSSIGMYPLVPGENNYISIYQRFKSVKIRGQEVRQNDED